MNSSPSAEKGKAFLTAQWRHLAMLNYEIAPETLEDLVPRGTRLDFFEGKTYLSVVGFMFLDTRLLGLPIPFHRHFEEVNLRFYLCRDYDGQLRRGVGFIKELVPRWAIATVAKTFYNEPYQALPMRHQLSGFDSGDESPAVEYGWRLDGRWNSVRLRAVGQCEPLANGSLEEFIAEHYWGYCAQRDGGTIEYSVQHPRWNAWQGAQAELDCDVERLVGARFAEALSVPPSSSFIADGSAVSVSRPTRICR